MKAWWRRKSYGLLPGVAWPEPAQALPASSQIIEPVSRTVVFTDAQPQGERCASCERCPRRGR